MKRKIAIIICSLCVINSFTGCVYAYEKYGDNLIGSSKKEEVVSENVAVSENETIFEAFNATAAISEIFEELQEKESKELAEKIVELGKIDETKIDNIRLKNGYPGEECNLVISAGKKEYIVRLSGTTVMEIFCDKEAIYQDEEALEAEKAKDIVYYEPTTAKESTCEKNRDDSIEVKDYSKAKSIYESWKYNFISDQEPSEPKTDDDGNIISAGSAGYFICADDTYNLTYKDLTNDIASIEFFKDNGNVVVIDHIKGKNYEIAHYYDLESSRYVIRVNVESTELILEGEDDNLLIEIANAIGYWSE